MQSRTWDVAILGSGPVGLEAAAAAAAAGLDVLVLEAGAVAEHLARWGHVELFTPFAMNAGPAGRAWLTERRVGLPAGDRTLSAGALRERYLMPLAETLEPSVTLLTGQRVVAVSRGTMLKGEALGLEARARQPFRILAEAAGSDEREFEARAVLDCTGNYGRPNWAGPGGTPARGERAARPAIRYDLPDILGRDRAEFANGRTFLIGGGHSAATTALDLAALAAQTPGTGFVWATRGAAPPLATIADDPLPPRRRLADRANALAADPPPGSAWVGGATLEAIHVDGDSFRVSWRSPEGGRSEPFDRVIANVGHEPDDSLYRQLQIHECYASRGPMKLAAALIGASGGGPADCLALGGFGPDALRNPEPGYFILGIKSYGKNSAFLLQVGYEQVADALEFLGQPVA